MCETGCQHKRYIPGVVRLTSTYAITNGKLSPTRSDIRRFRQFYEDAGEILKIQFCLGSCKSKSIYVSRSCCDYPVLDQCLRANHKRVAAIDTTLNGGQGRCMMRTRGITQAYQNVCIDENVH